MIDRVFRSRAEAALTAVEQQNGVRILLAIESGSRAWDFPSRDSDYDVRFIFVRPLAEYLSIVPPRDVIERPIDAELDLGGWDLRKALGLMVRSNAVVLEWLASPVVYRIEPAAVMALSDLARIAAHPAALSYHYDRLARGAWSAGEADIGPVTAKLCVLAICGNSMPDCPCVGAEVGAVEASRSHIRYAQSPEAQGGHH